MLPQIDTLFIANEKFIQLNKKFVKIVIDEAETGLFVEHKCKVVPPGKPSAYGGSSQTSSATSYSTYASSGMVYNLKLPDDFKILPYNVFWINLDGKLQSFSNIGQLKRIFRDKKRLVNDYLKANEVNMSDESVKAASISEKQLIKRVDDETITIIVVAGNYHGRHRFGNKTMCLHLKT